jgi:hypothetical protein
MQLSKILTEIDLEISRLEQAKALLAGESSTTKTRARRSLRIFRLAVRRNATFPLRVASALPKPSAAAGNCRRKPLAK